MVVGTGFGLVQPWERQKYNEGREALKLMWKSTRKRFSSLPRNSALKKLSKDGIYHPPDRKENSSVSKFATLARKSAKEIILPSSGKNPFDEKNDRFKSLPRKIIVSSPEFEEKRRFHSLPRRSTARSPGNDKSEGQFASLVDYRISVKRKRSTSHGNLTANLHLSTPPMIVEDYVVNASLRTTRLDRNESLREAMRPLQDNERNIDACVATAHGRRLRYALKCPPPEPDQGKSMRQRILKT